MSLSTKAIGFGWLALAVIAIVILIVLLLFGRAAFVAIGGGTKEDLCAASVVANTLPGIVPKTAGELAKYVDCPIINKTLKGHSEREIAADFLKHILRCAEIWQFNKRKLFESRGEEFCALCYIIDFENTKLKILAEELQEVAQSTTKPGTFKTYYAVLEELGGKEGIWWGPLNTAEKYVIMFKYSTKDFPWVLPHGFNLRKTGNIYVEVAAFSHWDLESAQQSCIMPIEKA